MKKFLLGTLLAAPIALTAMLPASADAAMSSWQSVDGKPGCSVRVWTDAATYNQGADTLDWYAESQGCGKLEFATTLTNLSSMPTPNPETQRGWFTYRTPTKSFNLNNGKWTWGWGSHTTANAKVYVQLSENGTFLDSVQSDTVVIHKQ